MDNHKEYMLFLDESYTEKFYSIGGVIIKKDDYQNLDKRINDLKKILWGENFESNREKCILHAVELNNSKKSKKNSDLKEENIKKFYNELAKFIRETDVIPIFSTVNKNLCEFYYNSNNLSNLNYHFFCFENIMQTYIHFLEQFNGIGEIVCEAQNGKTNLETSPDYKIINHFLEIKMNNKGIHIFNSMTTRNRLRNISIIEKNKNNNLLQLSDCLLYWHLKRIIGNNGLNHDLTRIIYEKIYNGNINLKDLDIREFWGSRIFPNDISYIKKLEEERKKMRNSLKNLKNSLRKLEKKCKKLQDEKKKLRDIIDKTKV